jgi:hypothetical protein
MEARDKRNLSFEEWCEEKDARRDELRDSAAAKAAAAAELRKAKHAKNSFAFGFWVENKALVDRSIELLGQLNSKRANSQEGWLEIGRCLAAVQAWVTEKTEEMNAEERAAVQSFTAKRNAITNVFMNWTRKQYSFEEVGGVQASEHSNNESITLYLSPCRWSSHQLFSQNSREAPYL